VQDKKREVYEFVEHVDFQKASLYGRIERTTGDGTHKNGGGETTPKENKPYTPCAETKPVHYWAWGI